MAATRISYHQLAIEPQHLQDAYAERRGTDQQPHDGAVFSRVIPHVEGGWCQCVGATLVGNNHDAGRWMLEIVVFEPCAEPSDANPSD